MGPSNEALVRFFHADRAFNAAQAKLDAATRDVRLQQRRVDSATERKAAADAALRDSKADNDRLALELKARDEHIEKLRTQQQTARNNKEYQALLMEISTSKVDREKIEGQAMTAMESVETNTAERAAATAALGEETSRHKELSAGIEDRAAVLRAEVEKLRPARDAARAVLPATVLAIYDKLSERYDGDALSPLERPDDRKEMYVCGECNVEQRVDVFYRLHSRDDFLNCDNCRRYLYLPEGMTPETAVNQKKVAKKRAPKKAAAKKVDAGESADDETPKPALRNPTVAKAKNPDVPAPWRDVLDEASADSLSIAQADASGSVECGVMLDGTIVGFYRGKSADHLEKMIRRKSEPRGLTGDLQVHRRDTLEAPAGETAAAPTA